MGITVTRPGVPVDTGKTSKFLAVNPNECIFRFNREDYDIVKIEGSSGFAAIVVDTNIQTELAVGDGIYFTSSKYSDTASTIKSYSYSSGDDETTIVLDLAYAGSDDTASGKYLNLIDGRSNYKIALRIFHALTHAPLVSVPGSTPFKDGELEFDLSSYLQSQLSLEPTISYSSVHSPNTTNSLPFYIKYQASYSSTTLDEVSDDSNVYTAVGAAQQIQTLYGANMGEYVSFNDNLSQTKKGSWMTNFKSPTYWEGYPWGLGFCFQDEGDQNINMKRYEARLDANGTTTGTSATTMDQTDMFYPNHVCLSGNYSAGVDSINLWVETNLNISYCGLLLFGQAFDLDDWDLDGSNNLLGIKVDRNTLQVASIDTRPDGSLYNPSGQLMDTLTWDAGDSRYEPSGTHNINAAGWYAVIGGISVTMVSGFSSEVCANQQFYQVSDGPNNLAPTLSSLAISGDLDTEGTLTASYIYADNESDLQDTGGTTEGFYTYTDSAGTLGRTFAGSGKTLNLNSSYLGKYIRFESTPEALTGTSPGIKYESSVYGPIVDVQTFTFQTDHDPTDGAFSFAVTYTGAGSIRFLFEDGSTLSGNSISTSANGLDGTDQDIVLKVQDLTGITTIGSAGTGLKGSWDLTSLTGLTILSVYDNDITSMTFSSSHDFTSFNVNNNSNLIIAGSHFAVPSFSGCSFKASGIEVTGTLTLKSGASFTKFEMNGATTCVGVDFSNVTFSGDDSTEIDLSSITTCTAITFPSSSGGTIGQVRVNSTAIASLDVSGISILGVLIFKNCTSLTSVTYGTQTNEMTHVQGDGCTSLTGNQDLSNFTYLPDQIKFNNAPIAELTLPTSSNAMAYGIYLNNCNISSITNLENCTNISNTNSFALDIRNNTLTSGELNVILDDFDSVSTSGYTGRTVNAAGDNSDPTSGPPDGGAAVISLTDDGFTVTTS